MPLTDTAIRNAKPKSEDYKIADGRGLFLLVTATGSKLWRMRFKHLGKEQKLSFGGYPDLSLKDARERCDNARSLIAAGRNPALEKQREKVRAKLSAATTFGAVATEYVTKREREGLAPATIKTYRHFQALLAPKLRARPIAEIEPFELLAALRSIESRGKLETASRSREFAGRVFRYAVATARAKHDIAADLRGALQAPTVKGFAAIIEPEVVGELLRAIDGYHGEPQVTLALRLSPLVFQRPGEVARMEWTEVDLNAAVWRLAEGRKKERREHALPLARQAVEILEQAKPIADGGKYVFPSLRTTDRPMTPDALNAALRRLGYPGTVHVTHGWRKTASTILNQSNQWNPDAIERALAHKDTSVRGIYNIGAYWDERVRMAQWWADYLDALKADYRSPLAH
ncbi:MAG: tyrosine-type recombinase/integrase [Caulobacteraceae bacterium]